MYYEPIYYSSTNTSCEVVEEDVCKTLLDALEKTSSLEEKTDLVLKASFANRGDHREFFRGLVSDLIAEGQKINNHYTLGWSYFILGWQVLDHERFASSDNKEEATTFFQLAQKEFRYGGDRAAEIRALNGEASAHRQHSKFDKAFEKYLAALDIAEEIGDDMLTNVIYSNLGVSLTDLKLYDEAIDYFEKIKIAKLESEESMALYYNNLSIAYREAGSLLKAEEAVKEALALSEKSFARANSSLQLCLLLKAQGKKELARKHLEECLELTNRKNIPRIRAGCLLHIALLEMDEGSFRKAQILLKEALVIFKELKTRGLEIETMMALAEVYRNIDEPALAYDILIESKELESQLYNEEVINRMGVVKVQQTRRENVIFKELYNRITTISTMGQAITASLDIKEIGKLVYENIKLLMEADNLIIGLYDEENHEINYPIFIVNEFHRPAFTRTCKEDFLAYKVITSREVVLINDLEKLDDHTQDKMTQVFTRKKPFSLICCPLITRDKTLGVISIQSNKKNAYEDFHLDILKALAAYVAIALENGGLFSHINKLARTDFLTGLPNRRFAFEEAAKEFSKARRYGDSFSVIIADIDKFKAINDNYGHDVGDVVLKEVSKILLETVRETDTLGRIGGEEFLFVLPNTDIEQARILADRLRRRIYEKGCKVAGKFLQYSISFGVAEIIPSDSNIEETIKRADHALYSAKEVGGNVVKTAV